MTDYEKEFHILSDEFISEKRKQISSLQHELEVHNAMIEMETQNAVIQLQLTKLGEAGIIADKVSDLILFHKRVRKNAEKRYM